MKPHTHYWQHIPGIANILLVLGLIGGIGLRMTIFGNVLGKTTVHGLWYAATVAYIIFYAIRISIVSHRQEICHTSVFARLEKNQLDEKDRAMLIDMLHSYRRSKVKYNYIAWLTISILSLVGALFLS